MKQAQHNKQTSHNKNGRNNKIEKVPEKPHIYHTEKKRPAQTKFFAVEHLDKIGETAVYYGFSPIKSPAIEKADIDAAKGIVDHDFVDDETIGHGKLPLRVEEKIALIRKYESEDLASKPQPIMIYMKDPCRGATRKSGCHRYADLEILGTSGPIAEATLIQAGRAMLGEEGYKDTRIDINSVGDRESMARWSRELTVFYRKNINDMTAECRQLFKQNPFLLLTSHIDAARTLNLHAPRSMDFLSEESRRYLEEILEYLETLGVPYTINNSLIGNRSYCTETVFTIVNAGENSNKSGHHVLGIGVRYNGLAKRLGMKRDIQGVGLSLTIKGNGHGLRDTVHRMKRPVASFVQLGIESKLLSLDVIEKLRQARIPLYLSLSKDRLGAQVSTVEKYHTPYVIVIGKKEAMDKTAIVRHIETYSQETVPIEKLPEYMKKMEKDFWKK
ncbi:MAG: His/Gly/Thr/Pro-type tRNA ligase C-terminal domain-containing protein [Candidatus Taylorbacteria bacterium]|nr:His/Gly/Thr/Pro-type tRNA ligase C-terminal domain-containing protein [Candidatus Taylorbacteria bacterium]